MKKYQSPYFEEIDFSNKDVLALSLTGLVSGNEDDNIGSWENVFGGIN